MAGRLGGGAACRVPLYNFCSRRCAQFFRPLQVQPLAAAAARPRAAWHQVRASAPPPKDTCTPHGVLSRPRLFVRGRRAAGRAGRPAGRPAGWSVGRLGGAPGWGWATKKQPVCQLQSTYQSSRVVEGHCASAAQWAACRPGHLCARASRPRPSRVRCWAMAAAAAVALAASSASGRRKEETQRRPAHLDLSSDTRITSAQLLSAKLGVKKEGFFSSAEVTPLHPEAGAEVRRAARHDRAGVPRPAPPRTATRCTPCLGGARPTECQVRVICSHLATPADQRVCVRAPSAASACGLRTGSSPNAFCNAIAPHPSRMPHPGCARVRGVDICRMWAEMSERVRVARPLGACMD